MRCIDTLTAPDAFVALHKRAIRAAAEVVDSPAGALFVRAAAGRRLPMGRLLEHARGHRAGAARPSLGRPVRDGRTGSCVLDGIAGRRTSWLPELPRAWIGAAAQSFRRPDRLRRPGALAGAVQTGPGGLRPATGGWSRNREPGRRAARHAGPDADPGASRIQSAFRVRHPRYQERFRTALDAFGQCRGSTPTIPSSSATCWRRCGPPSARSPACCRGCRRTGRKEAMR